MLRVNLLGNFERTSDDGIKCSDGREERKVNIFSTPACTYVYITPGGYHNLLEPLIIDTLGEQKLLSSSTFGISHSMHTNHLQARNISKHLLDTHHDLITLVQTKILTILSTSKPIIRPQYLPQENQKNNTAQCSHVVEYMSSPRIFQSLLT